MNILSDGSESKVKVASAKLATEIQNVALPYLSTDVYEEAEIENGVAPLLPGTISVYRDGAFIGTQVLNFTPIGKKFKVSIGLSQDISIKRTLVKKFEDDSGIVRSFRKIQVQYETEVENLSAQDKTVLVLERKIESRNEKISLTLTPPKWEWPLTLKPKEKKVLPYSATVEFPTSLTPTSLALL